MERYTIREWKGLRGISSEKLAEMCDVSAKSIANWQKDGGSIKISHAYKLAKAFGCTLDQIIFMP